jgi:hypothetical protein
VANQVVVRLRADDPVAVVGEAVFDDPVVRGADVDRRPATGLTDRETSRCARGDLDGLKE